MEVWMSVVRGKLMVVNSKVRRYCFDAKVHMPGACEGWVAALGRKR